MRSGTLKWKFKTGEDPAIHNQVGIQSSADVADGIVYFGCRDSNLYALDVKRRKNGHSTTRDRGVISSPAVDKGRVYFSTSDTGLFYALDAKTGTVVFSVKFTWPLFSSRTIAGNTIYLGSNAGKFMAIDLAAQKQAWTYETDASRQNGPAYTKADGTPD